MISRKIHRITFIVIGIVFFVLAILSAPIANIHAGAILTYFIGAVFLSMGIFFDFFSRRLMRILAIIFIVGVIITTAFVCVLLAYGNSSNATYNEDAVIVLGAGIRGEKLGKSLLGRLNKTIEYCEENPDAVIVVSGGQGHGESITEALAMERYLTENGIPQEKIIKEERATSTKENFEYSKELLDDYFDEKYSITFITSEFHVYRAGTIARSIGYDNMTYVGSRTLPYLIIPNGFRECLAVIKTWVLG